jgi:hypothetical protein
MRVRYKYTIKTAAGKVLEFKTLKAARTFAQHCEGMTIINHVRI